MMKHRSKVNTDIGSLKYMVSLHAQNIKMQQHTMATFCVLHTAGNEAARLDTATSFLRNTTLVCRRANTDYNACMIL